MNQIVAAIATTIIVISRIFHADHGVEGRLLNWALGVVLAEGVRGFFLRTLEVPAWASDLENRLHGPRAGDEPVEDRECFLARRSADRPPSRLCERPPRPSRLITVIGIVAEDGSVTVFTAHGGPAAEREVGDPSLESDPVAKAASLAFWEEHALSATDEQIAAWREAEAEQFGDALRLADEKKSLEQRSLI